MIRKLKSGEYRLYSRKKDVKTGSVATWERSPRVKKRKRTSAPCSISSGIPDAELYSGDRYASTGFTSSSRKNSPSAHVGWMYTAPLSSVYGLSASIRV